MKMRCGKVVRSLAAVACAGVVAGCVAYDPAPPYYAYAPGYYSAPEYYAAPAFSFSYRSGGGHRHRHHRHHRRW
jgi:hypothetical protein